ncbi:MAG: hypothetical protein ACI9IA_001949 [Enterobacterales bacterium]|jgi:hypothetical protein
MILRSVTKHVKDQNWFAIILDLLIVVFGVFIGMQVSNWNENLESQRVANKYLKRLVNDLHYEKKSYQNTMSYFETVLSYTNSALEGYKKPMTELGVDFLIDHYQASHTQEVPARRGTYDELLATGRIEFISNEKTRKAISNFYETSGGRYITMRRNTHLPYRTLIRMQMDETIQMNIRKHCGDIFNVEEEGVYHIELPSTCEISVPNSLIRQDVEKILSNDNIKQALRLKQSALFTLINSLNNGVNTVDIALKTLEEVN